MITPRPWKVGKQQSDGTWCVVTTNHVAEGLTHTDDAERYGGSLVAKGLTLANARLVACAPDLLEAGGGMLRADDGTDFGDAVSRIFTGMPV